MFRAHATSAFSRCRSPSSPSSHSLASTTVGWDRLIALILVVVLFVPIGRYRLPGSLPFNLELYRVVVALCILVWAASLLVDSRVRLRSTAFDRPLALIAACVLASEITNPGRVNAYGVARHQVADVLPEFHSRLLPDGYDHSAPWQRGIPSQARHGVRGSDRSFRGRSNFERTTTFSTTSTLCFPFLSFEGALPYSMLGGNLRVFGPAQQPIALGAALILILPVAVYFARTAGRRRWWLAALLILLGALASGSRTAVVMLAAEVIVFLLLKPNETKKLWPALIPAIAVVHFALPGTIGGLKDAFFPKGGLIAQQSRFEADYNPLLAGGRIRLIKPMLSEASGKPFFGEGYGTRISGFNEPDRNAPILDDQWLNNVLDVGFVGLGAWVWLMVRAVRRLFRASRAPDHDR